jgi:general secretion pathway protein K
MIYFNRASNKKHGAALITVLVIVFMIMAIIANITVENYRVIKSLANQKIQEQAQSILEAATSFGRAGLATSAVTSKTDTLQDIWAQPIPKSSVLDNVQMSGYIIDEQGEFNINDLVANGVINQNVLRQFGALLGYLNLPTTLGYAIAVYMASPQNQGDVINQYTMDNPAYRPAGRPLIDISELVLVKGVSPNMVYKLAPYISAIPQNINFANESSQLTQQPSTNSAISPSGNGVVTVNVNTASAEVIAAKSGIPLPIAQRMVTSRITKPFVDNNDVTNFLTSNGVLLSQNTSRGTTNIQLATLTTTSQYFTIHAVVNSGDYDFRMVTLVYRLNRSGQWPRVLWQHPE